MSNFIVLTLHPRNEGELGERVAIPVGRVLGVVQLFERRAGHALPGKGEPPREAGSEVVVEGFATLTVQESAQDVMTCLLGVAGNLAAREHAAQAFAR